ncbi:MAG TPA: tripartite tricarboxylate transporter substrate binding protein [Burkholderiales bacterium]|nr:tripartite tricarboxylate transporter substrate binding protein [Burkholderiales bacterium]
MNTTTCTAAAIGAAVISAAAVAQTANYPNRVVKFIVPVAAGGTVDIVARTLAQRMTESLGQQVIVENRPSASSLVGTQVVAKSAPDGYTLLATSTTFLSAPAVVKDPGYDPLKDFAPITLTCRVPMVLDVSPNLPVRSIKEFIALAKTRPGDITYAASGVGSTGHIAGELFARQAGIKMLAIQYKGNAQSIVEVIGGQVAMMFDQIGTSAPYIKAGKLRPLGITSKKRSQLFPELPTIDEAGLPGYEDYTINVLLAPAGTPKDILARLHAEVTKIAAAPDLHKRFLDQGIELIASPSPDDFSAYVKTEVARYAKLAKDAGIKAD